MYIAGQFVLASELDTGNSLTESLTAGSSTVWFPTTTYNWAYYRGGPSNSLHVDCSFIPIRARYANLGFSSGLAVQFRVQEILFGILGWKF